ncbi:GMC family oxidoreductase N-terminal domain-containing protein [Streptomyces sp. NPDC050439]|uniref:GMC family oxidoreductase n=1 Tax=unclassified Streptomyces TaxID=2593676 RepID=UPI003445593C
MPEPGWDLIVVGAGSAGAALAARSAAAGRRVLLLEAGPDYRSAQMPEVWRSPNPVRALLDPTAAQDLVWPGLNATRTDRQPQIPYWRGRGVGGSSSVNGQIAIRPPMEDFDDWDAAGCTGWSGKDVLPYFAKLEDDAEFGDEPYHGHDGPTPIFRTPQSRWGGADHALHEAARAAGYAWAPDVNAPGATGISPYPINSRSGRRVSVNDAYLEPARDLATLTVRGGALVDRVVFSGNRAVGVRVLADGAAVTEYGDEIVLSAGAIHSPAILLRSGIGPSAHLRELGISVRADLPVGVGLQDHPMIVLELPLTREAAIKTPDDRHTNVCVRYTSGPGAYVNDMMFVSLNQNVLSMAAADTDLPAGGVGVWLNQTYSRGHLQLVSANPTVQPQVHERMLSDARDRSRLRAGVRELASLATGPAVASAVRAPVPDHNASLFAALEDDGHLDDHLLTHVVDAQHGTSTCRMGSSADTTTVVDPACRVHGLQGLRVVDASVFPSVPRANTNLAAIMVGELMADRLG